MGDGIPTHTGKKPAFFGQSFSHGTLMRPPESKNFCHPTYYNPYSPAAQHLVDRCVHATLVSDRCQRAHDAALADQVDAAAVAWEQGRWEQVAATWAGLAKDPGATVAALERDGQGCRQMIGRW